MVRQLMIVSLAIAGIAIFIAGVLLRTPPTGRNDHGQPGIPDTVAETSRL
jgi:hypothetical protein